MKTLDDLVIGRNGLWFTLEEASKAFQQSDSLFMYDSGGSKTEPVAVGVRLLGAVISKEQFQQRAKELGFVGRYRWGVQYKTDGKRPELDDDVEVAAECACYDTGWISPSKVSSWRWGLYGTFKITDQRYKPADTSYLDKPERCGLEAPENLNHKCSSSDVQFKDDNDANWYCYETQKALRLPPVGAKLEFNHQTDKKWAVCFVVAEHHYRKDLILAPFESSGSLMYANELHRFRPLDHDRKAKAERKRVVDAARDFLGSMRPQLEALYDKGFLRMPENKK